MAINVDYVKLRSKGNYNNAISPFTAYVTSIRGKGQFSNTVNSYTEPGNLYLIPSFTVFNFACPQLLGQYFMQFFIQFFEDSANEGSFWSTPVYF